MACGAMTHTAHAIGASADSWLSSVSAKGQEEKDNDDVGNNMFPADISKVGLPLFDVMSGFDNVACAPSLLR